MIAKVRDTFINWTDGTLFGLECLDTLKFDFTRILGTSKVTGKFQITVPKVLVTRLKLKRGDLVVFVGVKREVLLKKGEVRIK
jgi:hypothetical protein